MKRSRLIPKVTISFLVLACLNGAINFDFLFAADGGKWSVMGSGMNNFVVALAVAPNGTLYAGGLFTSAGGAAANGVAKWNGSSWAPLGAGVATITCVNALVVAPDGTIYVGGTFRYAGGIQVNAVAKWDGSNWSALGSGLGGGEVLALALGPDGTLYAGGSFTHSGITSIDYIAKWNGTTWSALGSGTESFVMGLAVGPDGTLYTDAYCADGESRYISKWDGSAWTQLGEAGLFGLLAVAPNGTLYAGGYFSETLSGLAKWDGSAWVPLGQEVITGGGSLQSLKIPSDGSIYAVGVFFATGDYTTFYNVAKWNGSAWSPIDTGPNASGVLAIEVAPDGTIYAGGEFTEFAGINGANYIARYSPSSSPQTSTTLPGILELLLID